MMKEQGLDINSAKDRTFFFVNADWNLLFNNGGIINDAINKIKIINDSKIFQEVIILTKLSGNYFEEMIRVITLPVAYNKSSIVNAKGNILIDDEFKNVKDWINHEGIGIWFLQEKSDLDNDIIDDIMDVHNTSSVKEYIKTRNNS